VVKYAVLTDAGCSGAARLGGTATIRFAHP
jgi:hypothetical protein